MLGGLSQGEEGCTLETQGSPETKALEVTLSPQQIPALVQAAHFHLKTTVFYLENGRLLRMGLSSRADSAENPATHSLPLKWREHTPWG